MSKKILLLNTSYEVLSFIVEKKALKLLSKDNKVEVVSEWPDIIKWGQGQVHLPAILRLKNHVRRNYFNSNFSRRALIKRDRSQCQYCAKSLSAANITIDHVLPRSQGGITSFNNCVVSCFNCNNNKADRTPEQARMVLMKKPSAPSFATMHNFIDAQEHWHPQWSDFIKM